MKEKIVEINKYDMGQAASKLGMTRGDLFAFLRKYNLIQGKGSEIKVNPSILVKGYFTPYERVREVGRYGSHKLFVTIYVTKSGMKFLTQITKLLISKY